MIELGYVVKDSVSGFKGVAVAKTKYLNGCNRICVQPEVKKDGKLPEQGWFDEPQLIVEKKKVKKGSQKTGGIAHYIPSSKGIDKR